jgi:hypothetical protein
MKFVEPLPLDPINDAQAETRTSREKSPFSRFDGSTREATSSGFLALPKLPD